MRQRQKFANLIIFPLAYRKFDGMVFLQTKEMEMTYAAEGNRATALRIINAHKEFNATLINIAGITSEQAEAVTKFYLGKCKAAKLDAVVGRISVKHGAFLDKDVILRAVAAA